MPTLNWIGKDKVVTHHHDVPYRVLDPKYTFGDIPNSGNKIIHGDNLEALKALLPEYEGKIKCIYIDPPYNTGNEGWVYNDNVSDPHIQKWLGKVVGSEVDDLTRHDKWLCMMYPRLILQQKLLSEDGAIFISIDDNELTNLKTICDEIFGFSNFVGIISWFKKSSPSNDAKFFSNDVEYILVYAKNKNIWRPNRLSLTEKQLENYQNPDNDPRGSWNSATYTCNKSKQARPNLYYPILNPNTNEYVYPKETAVWAYSKEQCEQHQKDNMLYWGVDGKAKFPRFKKFLSGHQGVVNRTMWHYDDVNHTQGATMELKKLQIPQFDTPKPTLLIERILQIASNKDSIILDSFAGSGTTAHAVLNMNKKDGGNRRFVVCEMMDYADTITAERVKRVINGYGEGSKTVEGTGGSFDFYELGETIFDPVTGYLNDNADTEQIRRYVWYSETKTPYEKPNKDENPYLLGHYQQNNYYFYYIKDESTCLNWDFLNTLTEKDKAELYIIYADRCVLTEEEMIKYNIRFKQIPRDIKRV